MKDSLYRLFGVRPGEAGIVGIMSFLLLTNTVGREMAGIVGIADVINIGGVNQTLLVNGINGILILITAALTSLIVDRFNRIALLRWLVFGFAFVFCLLTLLRLLGVPPQVSAALVYLMSQQQWLVFPIVFWVLANDIFELAQAKRLIPVIGSWAFIGKLMGISIAILPRYLASWGLVREPQLTLETVLMVNVVIYMLGFVVLSAGLRRVKLRERAQSPAALKETLSEGLAFVREVPSYRFLMIAVTCIAICDMIVEFRFFVVAKAAIADPIEYKQFYAFYLLAAALISFVIQAFLTSRVIAALQLKNTFLVQPSVAFTTVVAMLVSSATAVAVAASLILKIFRNTIDEATKKAFQGLVPEERRGRVSIFLDNYMPALGLVLGSVIAGVTILFSNWLQFQQYDYYIYLGIAAVLALFAMWNVNQMRHVYDTSLLNWRLRRRKVHQDIVSKLDF